MRFHSFPASWRSGPSQSRRPQPRPARRGRRPVLEPLDDRVLLTTYSAASVSDLIADINASNKAGGSNTITLTAPTTSPYNLTARNNNTNGGNGLPVIAANDNLTILGNGDTIERPLTDGFPYGTSYRLLDVAAGASLTLQDLTLHHGMVFGTGVAGDGGGILNEGTLVLTGVTVWQNYAGSPYPNEGGGTSDAGGGIWSNGSLTLESGTLMEGNQAHGGAEFGNMFGPITPAGDAYGGALYIAGGSASITNTTIKGNYAWGGSTGGFNMGGYAYGGALYVAAGQVVLTTTTVNNNSAVPGDGSSQATSYGGGLFIANAATVDIDAFTLANVINNTAVIDPNIDGTYIET
jgi:hypothetical protein